jgi:hypothetical protein
MVLLLEALRRGAIVDSSGFGGFAHAKADKTARGVSPKQDCALLAGFVWEKQQFSIRH